VGQAIAQSADISISESGEVMKWINEYFFGEEVHWTDYVWFFGPLAFGFVTCVYLYITIY